MIAHPDAELLGLCVSLREMQAEWQRLYDATSDAGPLTTPADHAWKDYSDTVWPAIKLASSAFHRQPHPDDMPGRLLRIRAMTPQGQAAKAAAILALDDVASWCDLRDDLMEMMHSLLRDVVGIEAQEPDAAPAGANA